MAPSMTLLLLPAFETAECGRLFDRGRGGGTEFPGVVILFPLLPGLAPPLPAGGLVAFMTFVCVLALERGWWGKRISSVRSHKHCFPLINCKAAICILYSTLESITAASGSKGNAKPVGRK